MNKRIEQILVEYLGTKISSLVISPIESGTNTCYMIQKNDCRYYLRIGTINTNELGINRKAELAAMQAASSIGVAPQIIYFSEEDGTMITRHIDGKQWTNKEFGSFEIIDKVIHTMKKVHNLPEIKYEFSPYKDIIERVEILENRNYKLPEYLDSLLEKMHEIQKIRQDTIGENRGLCHGDPFVNNFLYDGTVRLLDWEFAGMGDIFFDLASISTFFSQSKKDYLLTCYFGEVQKDLRDSLDQMDYIMRLWSALWAGLQTNTENSSNYSEMANGIFESIKTSL